VSVDPKSEVGRIIRRLKRLKAGYTKDFYRKWSALRKELYKTGTYQLFLREVRIRAMYRCQKCAKPGRHVHHIERVYDNPDRVVDVTNGMYLCVACHRKEHAKEAQKAA
jgi:hypothetical protein